MENSEKRPEILSELKELKVRARSLARNCMPDTYGPLPKIPPEAREIKPLLITHLLTNVLNLGKQGAAAADMSEDELIPQANRWPDELSENRDDPVLLFGFRLRKRTMEEKKAAVDAGEEPEREIMTSERLEPMLVPLPGTPLDLVDMYDAYVRGITDLEEYWEDTWLEQDMEEEGSEDDDTEEESLEEIKTYTRELAEEISHELELGEKGRIGIATLRKKTSDLDEIFDEGVIAETDLHEKIDRLAEAKFIAWLHRIPQGPSSHFKRIVRAIERFPFSNKETRSIVLSTIKRAARIRAHREKIG